MDIKTLESFRLADAISFHDELNPKLWNGMHLRPEVKKQLKVIADDFMDELGISGLDVVDVTVSGSNAAYSYTPHSDLDLHILVDMTDMPNDEVYKELFNAKKNIYNDSHDITIHGVPVELYVQDAREPVVSLGEYSLKDNDWIKLPTKRRANLDQTATKQKYNKLLDIISTALKSKNLGKINKVLKKIKQYRQAGLDKGGEFGPENLAFKVLRSQGYISKLYDLRDKLHSETLTIETMYQDPEKIQEAKVPSIRQQIIDAVKQKGGSINDYFIRFTDTDKLGFSAKQGFGQTPDVDDPKFSVDYIGQGYGRRALWFYPLSYYLNDKYGTYATDLPYVWLVKLKPNAWMQTVKPRDNKIQPAPEGKERVGMIRMSKPPAAIFFTHGFDVVGSYYDYAGQHKRHGEVKGRPAPSFFDRIRGIGEDEWDREFAAEKTPVVNPYAGIKDKQFRGGISEDKPSQFVYHVTPTKNLKSIAKQGLTPTVGDRASQISGEKSGIYVFPDKVSAEDAVMNWLGDEFDDEPLTMLKIDVSGLEKNITKGADYELIVGTTIEPKRIKKVNIQLEEASGYIPSEKEKNDPRFKTALTVDVHPYTMKKDAKKFSNKISRAGIPPTARPDGKF